MSYPVDSCFPFYNVVFKQAFTTYLPPFRRFCLFNGDNPKGNTLVDSENTKDGSFCLLSITNRMEGSFHSLSSSVLSWVTILTGVNWSATITPVLSPFFHTTLTCLPFPVKETYYLFLLIVLLKLIRIALKLRLNPWFYRYSCWCVVSGRNWSVW